MFRREGIAVAQFENARPWCNDCCDRGCMIEFALASDRSELHPLVQVLENLFVDAFVPRELSVADLAALAEDQNLGRKKLRQVV